MHSFFSCSTTIVMVWAQPDRQRTCKRLWPQPSKGLLGGNAYTARSHATPR